MEIDNKNQQRPLTTKPSFQNNINNQNSKFLLIIEVTILALMIILIVLVGIVAYYLKTQKNQMKSYFVPQVYNSTIKPQPTPTGEKCKEYRILSKDELYEKYSVQQGDSLLWISQKKLSDTSRIGEIVDLNKERYPYLQQNPFLEVGWTLYLPPKSSNYSTGTLGGVSGKIIEINNTYFRVALGPIPEKAAIYYIYHGKSPQFSNNFTYKVGDCVTVKYMVHYMEASQVPISISLQDHD